VDRNRISGLWLQFQEIAKANWKEPATAQDNLVPTTRQAKRQAGGIHDPLVRQIDYHQRMALMKREIEEVEREVVRFRAICEDTRETLRRLDKADQARTGH
jgi:hypothetical protein